MIKANDNSHQRGEEHRPKYASDDSDAAEVNKISPAAALIPTTICRKETSKYLPSQWTWAMATTLDVKLPLLVIVHLQNQYAVSMKSPKIR